MKPIPFEALLVILFIVLLIAAGSNMRADRPRRFRRFR
jgi:hypothetical protein